jgi:putative hydrolase of the HAD superfamily
LIAAGQEMLRHPIELLPHAEQAVRFAREHARVILVTKGDLLDQERKLAQSGLGELFDAVEIVSDKTPNTYSRIFGTDIHRAVMIGNSMKSDIRPMIDAGGWGVFVPHDLAWDLEHAAAPDGHPRYQSIDTLDALESCLKALNV